MHMWKREYLETTFFIQSFQSDVIIFVDFSLEKWNHIFFFIVIAEMTGKHMKNWKKIIFYRKSCFKNLICIDLRTIFTWKLNASLPWLPWRDDAIIRSTNQNHLTDFQKILSKTRRILGFDLIVDVWQEWAKIVVQRLLMWIIPVISNWSMLSNIRVK